MNIYERFGVSIDTPHKEIYGKVVEAIGLNKLRSIIPWTKEELTEAYKEDKHFNTRNTRIELWDAAAGFRENRRTGDIVRTNSPLYGFIREAGITTYSYSELVCILKEAARQIVEEVA